MKTFADIFNKVLPIWTGLKKPVSVPLLSSAFWHTETYVGLQPARLSGFPAQLQQQAWLPPWSGVPACLMAEEQTSCHVLWVLAQWQSGRQEGWPAGGRRCVSGWWCRPGWSCLCQQPAQNNTGHTGRDRCGNYFTLSGMWFALFFQVKTENPPLLFCILSCCFLSSHSTSPPLVMHVFGVCVCVYL